MAEGVRGDFMPKKKDAPFPPPSLPGEDNEFIVVRDGRVMRGCNGQYFAMKAWDELKPKYPEILYVKVGGQKATP